jgi:hypothetical protein
MKFFGMVILVAFFAWTSVSAEMPAVDVPVDQVAMEMPASPDDCSSCGEGSEMVAASCGAVCTPAFEPASKLKAAPVPATVQHQSAQALLRHGQAAPPEPYPPRLFLA